MGNVSCKLKYCYPYGVGVLLLAAGIPETSWAEAADTPSAPEPALQEVTVTARYQFLSAGTSRTTNLPLPVEKVPQSINIVSNDFINAAGLKTLRAIAEYTPGATDQGSDLGRGTAINLRGYTAEKAVDGLTTNDSFRDRQPGSRARAFGHLSPEQRGAGQQLRVGGYHAAAQRIHEQLADHG